MATELPGYRVIKQIGEGAASIINLAVKIKTGKKFAVKHVLRNNPDDDPFVAQVEREYEISSKLSHNALRKSFSIHRIRKLMQVKEIILVMEFIEGLNLEDARPNRLNTFLTLFQRVAQGLDAMHQGGFVHSDIKPTNIMLAKGGIVKIIDFGQSWPMNQRKDRIQGTPDYIAPEQVDRLPLDQRTDVFNLGATMYWVLTSENYPTEIRGMTGVGGANIISSKKPTAPIELNNKIPLALSNLVMECCQKSQADRPTDMNQLIKRLKTIKKLWSKHRETRRIEHTEAMLTDRDDQSDDINEDEPFDLDPSQESQDSPFDEENA